MPKTARAAALQPPSAGAAVEPMDTMRRVGAHIRRLRKRRNMTLQQLGAQSGTSVSMLSMLERGVATPSISTLVAVASALGTHMSDLFGAGAEHDSPVTRLAEQTEVTTPTGVIRRLVHNDPASGLEMVVNEYEPGTGSGDEPSSHAGTEFGIVLAGILTIQVDGQEHILKAGDAIRYPSTTPHRLTNTGRTRARAVWVNLDN